MLRREARGVGTHAARGRAKAGIAEPGDDEEEDEEADEGFFGEERSEDICYWTQYAMDGFEKPPVGGFGARVVGCGSGGDLEIVAFALPLATLLHP